MKKIIAVLMTAALLQALPDALEKRHRVPEKQVLVKRLQRKQLKTKRQVKPQIRKARQSMILKKPVSL